MVNGRITNLKHKQKFGNIDKEKIIGAYCNIILPDGSVYTELMTIAELRQAWSKSQMWSKEQTEERKGSTHDEFRQEMAKKTVINRACKKLMNSSDDSSLVIQYFNKSDETIDEAQVEEEIQENANKEFIDVEYQEREVEEEPAPNNQSQDEQEQMSFAPTGSGPDF